MLSRSKIHNNYYCLHYFLIHWYLNIINSAVFIHVLAFISVRTMSPSTSHIMNKRQPCFSLGHVDS